MKINRITTKDQKKQYQFRIEYANEAMYVHLTQHELIDAMNTLKSFNDEWAYGTNKDVCITVPTSTKPQQAMSNSVKKKFKKLEERIEARRDITNLQYKNLMMEIKSLSERIG